jgi:predicted DNA-binding protein
MMTSIISIRLDDKLFHEMRANANILHLNQTEYVREAIERMNSEVESIKRSQRLKSASLRVRKESMNINKEFGDIEHDPDA